MKSIVFFARYPNEEEQRDGFYQRVLAIDHLFQERKRYYVCFEHNAYLFPKKRRIDEKKTVIYLNPQKILHAIYLLYLTTLAGTVYAHSIINLSNRLSRFIFGLSHLNSILDVHGVVPEEFRMYGNLTEADAHERYEAEVVAQADRIIVVTNAMAKHFCEKYRQEAATFITLPIYNVPEAPTRLQNERTEQPRIVYAGGTQKWQCIPEMLSAIGKTTLIAFYEILVPEPELVVNALAQASVKKPVHVNSAPRAEVFQTYQRSDFGFILRSKSVVNRVACPTKLVEYLAFGVIPILDYAWIGDFLELGMQYLSLPQFVSGEMPTSESRKSMLESNYRALVELKKQFIHGSEMLKIFLK